MIWLRQQVQNQEALLDREVRLLLLALRDTAHLNQLDGVLYKPEHPIEFGLIEHAAHESLEVAPGFGLALERLQPLLEFERIEILELHSSPDLADLACEAEVGERARIGQFLLTCGSLTRFPRLDLVQLLFSDELIEQIADRGPGNDRPRDAAVELLADKSEALFRALFCGIGLAGKVFRPDPGYPRDGSFIRTP